MPSIRCRSCGLLVQVPAGGRRLCGCGTWLSSEDAPAAQAAPAGQGVPVLGPGGPRDASPSYDTGPRIEGDLSAIERLNDGYRRIRKEMAKVIVGQDKALEE